MSFEPAIKVDGLGKAYAIFGSAHSRLLQMMLRGRRKLYKEFWALREASFSVARGETVGIIGKNGSGKSTLLQLICGTLSPTTGSVSVSGRVAALLELGTGFNPEFSGRENVYVNGALLGMTRAQIDEAFRDIADFAAIGNFIEQPVKIYSSGMLVRLAISVAFHSKPSILVIDEALAVGDASFQRKCMRRISELVEGGATLLFVSHDAETVKSICSRAIYLEDGRVKNIGPAKEVCTQYERDLFGGGTADTDEIASPPVAYVDETLIAGSETQYGDGACRIEQVTVTDSEGRIANAFGARSRFHVKYVVKAIEDIHSPVFGMMVTDKNGSCIYGVNSSKGPVSGISITKGAAVQVEFILENNLGPGTYYLTCGVHSVDREDGLVYHHRRLDALIFKSLHSGVFLSAGFAQLNAQLRIESQ